jgi:hypothetical protein
MTIKSLQSTSLTNNVFYRSMLAGNDAFFPEFESDEFLEEVVLTSSASSVTFSGLDYYAAEGFKHLQIRAISRASSALGIKATLLNFNADTASNYAFHYLRGNGSSVLSDANPNRGFIRGWFNTDSSSNTGAFTGAVVDILDFNNSSKFTTTRSLEGSLGGNNGIALWSGLWQSTAAITSIAISVEDGFNYVAGSRFSLYGSKG